MGWYRYWVSEVENRDTCMDRIASSTRTIVMRQGYWLLWSIETGLSEYLPNMSSIIVRPYHNTNCHISQSEAGRNTEILEQGSQTSLITD